MKGPFANYEDARAAALPGEVIMARKENAQTIGAAWCVMEDLEATITINNWLSPWVHWEDVKEESQ